MGFANIHKQRHRNFDYKTEFKSLNQHVIEIHLKEAKGTKSSVRQSYGKYR